MMLSPIGMLIAMLLMDDDNEMCHTEDTATCITQATGYHYHKCDACSNVWGHNPHDRVFGNYDAEHTCKCGVPEYYKYTPLPDEKAEADAAYHALFTTVEA